MSGSCIICFLYPSNLVDTPLVKNCISVFFICICFIGCDNEEATPGDFILTKALLDSIELEEDNTSEDVPADRPINLFFSAPVDVASAEDGVRLLQKGNESPITFSQSGSNTLTIFPVGALLPDTEYELVISQELKSTKGISASPVTFRFRTIPGDLELISLLLETREINGLNTVLDVPLNPEFQFTFSTEVNLTSFQESFSLSPNPGVTITQTETNQIDVQLVSSLDPLEQYILNVSDELTNESGAPFDGYQTTLFTQVDTTRKFPLISDEELLIKVQEQTFKYFWDFGHPVSGLARERNTSGETVTIGGSGFGVMSIIVGIERGFITREEGIDRLEKIIDFLEFKAERFHGVWSHWLNGTTGEVIPFSSNDDGADLVETAFMIQALLTVREYLDEADPQEKNLIDAINRMWHDVEWDWFTQGGQNVLYWHWSPNFGWEKDLAIRGWNEGLIIYFLAASSPTHPIDKEVYKQGWARNGNIKNTDGNSYFGYELPLREDRGGPLFFAHYSFLGLDPRTLEDQ